MKPKIIFMPHANIQYSQLAPEKRQWVMKNCYEKLFEIIADGDYKIAFEASGITIEEMSNRRRRCLQSCARLFRRAKSSLSARRTFTLCCRIFRRSFVCTRSNTQ